MRLTAASVLLAGSLLLSSFFSAREVRNYLANNTILIIRQSEKPDTGTGLNAMGEARTRLYIKYFQPFQEEGLSIQVIEVLHRVEERLASLPEVESVTLSREA